MLMRTDGFVGIDSYDLVMYAAKVASNLVGSVLVIDRSNDRSLAVYADEFRSSDSNCWQCSDFYYTRDLVEKEGYDFVFVYYGSNFAADFSECDDLFLVTDYQRHNVERLSTLRIGEDVFLFLVMRDRLGTKITPESVYDNINEVIRLGKQEEVLIELADTSADLSSRISLQYDGCINMKSLSDSVNQFLVKVFSADFEEKEIKAALKCAVRGK